MKNLLTLLSAILFTCQFTIAQSALEVNIKDSRIESNYIRLSEFKLFKDDVLLKTITPEHGSQKIVKHLAFGSYRIEYETIFEKIETIYIEISQKRKYSIDLYIDYLNYETETYVPFISQLKNGESYSIQIQSQGCFHSSDETITIKRKADKYFIKYGVIENELTDIDIQTIKEFEVELNYMNSGGCTTVDNYRLKFKDKEVRISDGSCAWNGGRYLKKKLKLTE